MQQSNHALVLLWTGTEIPEEIVGKFAEILSCNGVCKPEDLTVTYKDENGIANSLIDAVAGFRKPKTKDNQAEAVKNAVIYIGTRFEDSLTETKGNLIKFAFTLSKEATKVSDRILYTNPPLINAMKIISETKAIIPAALAKKYHFTQQVVDVIKEVYKNL